MQNATYAVCIPIYLIIYLSTSPLVLSDHAPDFLIHTADIAAIPIALVLGYIVPAIMMVLPASSMINAQQKQTWMAIWQVFPLWTAIFHMISSSLISQLASPKQSVNSILGSLRMLYTGLLIVAATGQIATLTLMATSSWFPALFALKFQGVFNPSAVFLPVAATPSVKMSSPGEGLHLMLQYDQLFGSISMAIFATVVYAPKYHKSQKATKATIQVLYALIIMALAGPLGYTVACIWARDELVLGRREGSDKKDD